METVARTRDSNEHWVCDDLGQVQPETEVALAMAKSQGSGWPSISSHTEVSSLSTELENPKAKSHHLIYKEQSWRCIFVHS